MIGPVIFRNISFSEVSKFRAFDNEVVFIFNCVTCNTIFTWNTGWGDATYRFQYKGYEKRVLTLTTLQLKQYLSYILNKTES